jgi:predicted RNA-binding Zn ribbon-like protein
MSKPLRYGFRFIGGAAWLDLLSTRGGRYGPRSVERLDTAARLGEWLAAVGLAPSHPPGDADLAAAIELREAIQPLAQAVARGGSGDAVAVATLHRWLEAPAPRLSTGGERPEWAQPADAREALALLARQAAHGLADRDAPRLGSCEDDECRLVYLDPGGRRRWCSNAGCGSKARVRAYRARTRRAAPPQRS